MYLDFVDLAYNEIKLCISNNNYFQHISGKGSILIGNYHIYSHPNWKHFYEVDLKNIKRSIDVNNGYSVKGVFENNEFKDSMFCDSTFHEVTFKDCIFNKVQIENCKFVNCKFINCSGTISFGYDTTFERCTFINTRIKIMSVGSKPIYFESKKYYNKNHFNLYLE